MMTMDTNDMSDSHPTSIELLEGEVTAPSDIDESLGRESRAWNWTISNRRDDIKWGS
ncbi:hypothetical protein HJC23_007536 [Cyclotella cryptica]|uniref:Uncharacterized protein n=1 Tax=Cyclotella cryptica TaxID=29204 RepID=A0ABD3NX71_9STRA